MSDGIVASGIIPDDSRTHVAAVTCTIGEPYPRGQLVLHVTEVTAAGAA